MSESTTVSLGLPRPRTALPTETGPLPVVAAASAGAVAPRSSFEALTGPSLEELDTELEAVLDDQLDEDDEDEELGDGDPALELVLGEGDADAVVDWQERALCAQTDPESFFPEKGGSTREAKRVCMSCEVRVPCLEYALANDERFGIWGGLSERERRRVKRRAV
ncbi:WhiB family transcriptional regulator [Quadrisphaera sp. KR29]|uniref:WhiB family transcriptional regulator n=1 Tax=Quadrisphaera sp. KR29 TaxID=3461391 RepID=UPI004044E777